MGTSIVAHGNSTPTIDPAEHNLKFIPVVAEIFIINETGRFRFFLGMA